MSGATETAALEKRLDAALRSLRDIDTCVQECAERVNALCRAAQARLGPDRFALSDTFELLEEVRAVCLETENTVNSEAEQHKCNHIDEQRRARRDRFAAALAEVTRG